MRSIKWCHFQWPWTNPNPVFKITPVYDAKYLTNGYRYGHSYYRKRIGNRTQDFEWHQLQWPWVTSNRDFKVTILFEFGQITRKRYKIELYLQWRTNRKSHMVYRTAPFSMTLTPNPRIRVRVGKVRKPYPNFQMVPLSMTLSDLWPTFQGHDNIQRPITRL